MMCSFCVVLDAAKAGACFGEQALVSTGKSKAVSKRAFVMAGGVVMTLHRDDFLAVMAAYEDAMDEVSYSLIPLSSS